MKLTRKKKHHIDFEYQLEGSKLEFIDNIKYLGVHIANDLRWNKHVHEVTNKANKLLGMLRRNLYFCAKDVRETCRKICYEQLLVRRRIIYIIVKYPRN